MSPVLVWPSLLLLLLIAYRRLFSKKPKLPPSPPGLPILGNLLQIGPLAHRSLLTLSQKHGPLMLIRLGQVPALVASSADAAHDFLRTNDSSFLNRPHSRAALKLTWGGRNLSFSSYGEHWRRAKKASVAHLLSPARVRSFRAVRADEVALMVRRVAAAEPVVNLSEALYAYSNGVVSRAAAGRGSGDGSRAARFKDLLADSSVLIRGLQVDDLFPSLGWIGAVSGMDAKLERMARRFDEFLTSILEEHKKRGEAAAAAEEEDFVDVLLSLRGSATAAGEFIFDETDIKAIVMDMISVGTDTSYVTLEWAMTELIRNPQIMIKLQDEVRGISKRNSMVSEVDLEQMNYLKAVVKETLRLHTPAPLLVPRESIDDTVIQGYEIPAGTRVIINAWAIARDARSWESPEDFKPERFVGSLVDYRGQDFQFIPFGAGRRACPGMNFAIATIEIALANLVNCFNWALPDGMDVGELDMDEAPGLTTPKKIPLHLVATSYMN